MPDLESSTQTSPEDSTGTGRGGVDGEESRQSEQRQSSSRGRAWLRLVPTSGVLVPVVALWIALAIASPTFLTGRNISNLFIQGSALGVMAFATTLVIVAEEIDLSIGAVVGMSGVIAGTVAIKHGIAWPVAIAAALALSVAIGFVNGVVTTVVGIPSFVTTLAMLGLVTGVGLNITSGQTLYNFPHSYAAIGQGSVAGVKTPIIIAVAVMLILYFAMRRTKFGLSLYAVGGNRHAARLVGIAPPRVKTYAFMISAAGAGVAGIIESARLNSATAQYGSADLLNAIAAVVIGGTALTGGRGSVIDTALGVIAIATIQNGLDLLGVSPFWQQAAIGAVILVVATLDRRNRASASAR